MKIMRLLTLHDVLTAWQNGDISYREALERAHIDTLDELYEAAANSGVSVRTQLTPDETKMAHLVAPLIKQIISARTQ